MRPMVLTSKTVTVLHTKITIAQSVDLRDLDSV
jgi:hypothetical protein